MRALFIKKTKIVFRILQFEAWYPVPSFPDPFPSFTLPLLSSPQIPSFCSNPTFSAKIFLSSPHENNLYLYIFQTNIFCYAYVLVYNMWVMSWLTNGPHIWKIKVQVLALHLFTVYIRAGFCVLKPPSFDHLWHRKCLYDFKVCYETISTILGI